MNKEYLLKRPLDVSLSTIGILISSPIWLIISILIKINDNGPVFYAQKRVGKGGVITPLRDGNAVREMDEPRTPPAPTVEPVLPSFVDQRKFYTPREPRNQRL